MAAVYIDFWAQLFARGLQGLVGKHGKHRIITANSLTPQGEGYESNQLRRIRFL